MTTLGGKIIITTKIQKEIMIKRIMVRRIIMKGIIIKDKRNIKGKIKEIMIIINLKNNITKDKIVTITNLKVKEIDIKMIKTDMNSKKYNKNIKKNNNTLINKNNKPNRILSLLKILN